MAYAHAKGVIHRDLKPANVMVGHFGEVYVMDWGLARVIGRKDPHDIRPELSSTSFSIRTERREAREETPDSPLLTMGGDVVGTPAYMSPEQARGEVERLTARSDVYSLGAMLYHLLTGQMPYVPPHVRVSSRTVLLRVIEGPPRPVHELDESVPAELEAICDKAMAREPEERYADTSALAEDLRAYLEHRVVHAYETGAVAELRKWIVRNKALAAASAAGILALVAGLATSAYLYVQARRSAAEAHRNEQIANANAALARESEALARKRTEEVLRLSAMQDLDELVAEADRLWPAHPQMIAAYEAWLERAQALVAELPRHEAKLAELGRGLQPSPAPGSPASQDRWWHDQLSDLVQGLKALSDPERGLLSAGMSALHGWGVRRRLEFARTITERSVTGPEAVTAWEEALASIADGSTSPWYEGLELAPQLGLLPIGQDPSSGLWEFAHLQSGEPARRTADGTLVRSAETGLVLVLVPGGSFYMGAQPTNREGRNFDPQALPEERNVHEVTLAPFFLSKYELTQAQWLRATGGIPSFRDANLKLSESDYALRPVDFVSWSDCGLSTRWLGLVLPSEDQWEYAARAGTSSIWWTGDEAETLKGAANIADRSFGRAPGAESWEEWLDDGYANSAPTGSFAPNPFGLHDVHGNVFEWCSSLFDNPYLGPPDAGQRVLRGGSFYEVAAKVRCAYRQSAPPELVAYNAGLRPARDISGP
jgi:formylglycine-generating enzyme required for sulfatase activity